MKKDYQDRIDKYLMDRVPAEERQAFEKEADENAELREQLQFTQDVREAMTSRGEMLAKMQEWEKGYKRPVIKHFVYWASSIAAVLVIGLILLVRPKGILSSKDDEFDTVLSGSYEENKEYTTIDNMLQNKRYQEALSTIEKEIELVRIDSLEIATDSCLAGDESDYEMMRVKKRLDALKWLKAQALMGLGEHEESMLLLLELRSNGGDYEQDADSLLKIIKMQ